jgi:hypothetical protein
MQSSKYELRRKLMDIIVKELDMVLMHEERTYRLMIRSNDCIRLILISDDYEVIESKCLNNVRLSTVIAFLSEALLH